MTVGFFWDERCFWHGGGNYALTAPVGGFVQPGGGLPENPETKRRLLNLLHVSGMAQRLAMQGAEPAKREELLRVHPEYYVAEFESLSAAGGGEIGLRAPFGPDGYAQACVSAGLARGAVTSVLTGACETAYALSRPPGHHCLPDWPNGFCLLNNIAIALESARAAGLMQRAVVLDWDVHHGNGTEHIYYSDPNTYTISLHQERNYPLDTGAFEDRGEGAGHLSNLNIPLPPGTGHAGYLAAMDRIVLPEIERFAPEVIVVACGFDASAMDPLGRMLASAETFGAMTARVKALADRICGGRLVLVHEGGYSEMHVPFCGHAVLEELVKDAPQAPDPLAETLRKRQPGPRFDAMVDALLTEMAEAL